MYYKLQQIRWPAAFSCYTKIMRLRKRGQGAKPPKNCAIYPAADLLRGKMYLKKGLFFTDESPENTDTKAYSTDIECLKKLQISQKSRIFVTSKEIFQHWHNNQGQAPESNENKIIHNQTQSHYGKEI